ncbi:MAG: hypothetical protein IPP77_07840 [Bacteroidetes bacterium]|nr:hypothetical protein [Bacteroidota bacterium]
MNVGFSTGSLALGDFRRGIEMCRGKHVNAVELSALRESELAGLIDSLDDIDIAPFEYISFHAPSKIVHYSEKEVVSLLSKVAERRWMIIVHPDIITEFDVWQQLGQYLCIENMDKRKSIGRTFYDMDALFEMLPEASFCLDVAHARQVDPTMSEALLMLMEFRKRITQIHLSDVNSSSVHEPLNMEAILSYRRISKLIHPDTPIIIESPVVENQMNQEVEYAEYIFDDEKFNRDLSRFSENFIVKEMMNKQKEQTSVFA